MMTDSILKPIPLVRQTHLGPDLNWLWSHKDRPELSEYIKDIFFSKDIPSYFFTLNNIYMTSVVANRTNRGLKTKIR